MAGTLSGNINLQDLKAKTKIENSIITNKQEQLIKPVYVIKGAISNALCKDTIKKYSNLKVKKEQPFIGGVAGNTDLNIRNVLKVPLPLNQDISAILTSCALNLNHTYWQFNITHSNQTEFLIYDINGKYEAHVDTFHEHSDETRKISSLAILNDTFEGGKFYIINGHKKIYPSQNKGDVIVFPSFLVHGVEPVTKGIRYTAITWLVGPYFK